MTRRWFVLGLVLLWAGALGEGGACARGAAARTAAFGVAPHDEAGIEWWYVNAHVTTAKGRHLAVVGSFFRFGGDKSLLGVFAPNPAHYLIYAVTDLDAKTQRPYSLADGNMAALLTRMAPLLAVTSPNDAGVKALVASLNAGELPAPHQRMAGKASVAARPFRLAYGVGNTLTSTNGANTAFMVRLNGGADKITLTLTAQKPAMAVGGKGQTGLTKPTDMYYFSLTRCGVSGTIDTGSGPEKVTSGQGWFDHQWGNSWVAQNNGWDWWGVQLDDGTDVLFFRQRNLSTGKVFFPLATFMDKDGRQSVTRKIVFTPDATMTWKSAKTKVTYPLGWTVTFPEKHLTLHIKADVKDQEMPILGPGGGIWEGSCTVLTDAFARSPTGQELGQMGIHELDGQLLLVAPLRGTAYMELVGYGSPAVKRHMAKLAAGK